METLSDLQQAIGGRLLPDRAAPDAAATPLGRIVTDSRQIEPGDVFWTLEGPNHDGMGFVEEALRRGATGAVVAAPTQEGFPAETPGRWLLQVEDTYRALVDWATWKRRRFTGTLVAVTGSVGKATARQMIHAVLASRLSGTASPRNFNNHFGVPLSMLGIAPEHAYAVLELEASRPGDIAELAGLCRPKVGAIMPIGDTHPRGFGSRQAMAAAKAELLATLPPDGHAVLADDPWLHAVAARCAAPITWIGTSARCHLRAVDVQSAEGRLGFRLAIGEPSLAGEADPCAIAPVRFSVPVCGRHHLAAALAAVAVGRMMGFDLEGIAAALETFPAVSLRCEVIEIRGATIIYDAYNPDPAAMHAAMELLQEFDSSGRRIVVCGDMAEPGAQSAALHWQLGKQIVDLGCAELLIACGQFARHVAAGARAAGMIRARAIPCDSVEDALPYLGQAILPGDVVLVKGSWMLDRQRVIEALGRYPQRRSA